jgi:hypothetical protein
MILKMYVFMESALYNWLLTYTYAILLTHNP